MRGSGVRILFAAPFDSWHEDVCEPSVLGGLHSNPEDMLSREHLASIDLAPPQGGFGHQLRLWSSDLGFRPGSGASSLASYPLVKPRSYRADISKSHILWRPDHHRIPESPRVIPPVFVNQVARARADMIQGSRWFPNATCMVKGGIFSARAEPIDMTFGGS